MHLYVLSSCCDIRYDFRMERMFGSSLAPVVCRRAHMSFLRYLCLFWYSAVQRILLSSYQCHFHFNCSSRSIYLTRNNDIF
jgi:hypothetical protein